MGRVGRFGLVGWVGVAVSVGMLIWLAGTYDLQDLIEPLKTADYVYLLPVPCLVILNFGIRACRWRSLFTESAPKSVMAVFRAMMVGYLFNNLMPAHAGDLVRAYQLSRDEGLSTSKTLATLVAERTGDLLVLMGLLSAVLLFYPTVPRWVTRAGVGVGAVTLGLVSTLILLKCFKKGLVSLVARIAGRIHGPLVGRIEETGENFLRGIAGLFNPRVGAVFLTLTGLIWSVEVATAHLVGAAFNLSISLENLLFVLIVIALGTLVPSSPGYVGTFEFFGVSALGIVGFSGGAALSFVVTLHAIAILGSSSLGVVCLLGWRGYSVAAPAELRDPIN